MSLDSSFPFNRLVTALDVVVDNLLALFGTQSAKVHHRLTVHQNGQISSSKFGFRAKPYVAARRQDETVAMLDGGLDLWHGANPAVYKIRAELIGSERVVYPIQSILLVRIPTGRKLKWSIALQTLMALAIYRRCCQDCREHRLSCSWCTEQKNNPVF